MSTARRHFVRLGARTAHCRIAGSGPALVLLHQSPQNSRQWLGMIERHAAQYTVIAPDTPGFGDSDPLPLAQPGIADLAAATLELLDALGVARFALFGMHTGGLIGMHLAWATPERVAALVIDGFAAFNDGERAELGERYLPPFVPQWDGAHLRWLWSRMREQLFFFPWYDGRAARALRLDPPAPAATHAAVMDVLEVGDLYRLGYGAALRYGDRARVAGLRCPAWLLYRVEDVLVEHRERLPTLPPNVSSELITGGLPALHARIDAVLADTLGRERPVVPRLQAPADPGFRRCAIETAIGPLAAWHAPGAGVVQVRLHAPGTRPPRPQAADSGPAIWIDLPGHGGSSDATADAPCDALAQALAQLLQALAPGAALELRADGASAALALALAGCTDISCTRLTLHAPWLLHADEISRFLDGLPDPAIQRAGGHLLDAFQWERERQLVWPWQPPLAAARRLVDAPDPAAVHANCVELLRLGGRLRALWAGLLDPALAERITACAVPVIMECGADDDPQGRAAALTARLAQPPRMPA